MALNRFDQRLQFTQDTSREVTKLLARIDECKGYWEAFQLLSPEYLERMKRAVIISSSGSSTRIEGSHLSDKEVEQLLRTAKVRKLATRDEQEVMGYIETIKEVFDSWKAMKFSENFIKQVHTMTLKHSEKDARHKGQYKICSPARSWVSAILRISSKESRELRFSPLAKISIDWSATGFGLPLS